MSNQQFYFDKFISDLEDREMKHRQRLEQLNAQELENKNRELQARYRETAHQRMVIRGNDEN